MAFGTKLKTAGRRGVTARRRVAIAAAVGVFTGAVASFVLPWEVTPLLGYDVAVIVYVASIWLVVWKLDARQTARHAEREDPTRPAADLILLSAALASLVAVADVIQQAHATDGLREGVQVGFGVLSVLTSWFLIHTVYAVRYARLYYAGEDGGADFHQAGQPCFSDFAYLSFTIGMTFQVSDTELNSSEFRAIVLRHSLMSYLFGTVIVALTINLIAGLSR